MHRSLALRALALAVALVPLAAASRPAAAAPLERAVFAGGCFWGVQEVFEHVRGVTATTAGFAGGSPLNISYEAVSSGTTGHAESVEVRYDPAVISYAQLLDIYFTVAHDPTTWNRQGPDVGTQYRSVIFYAGDAQQRDAKAAIARLTASHAFSAPIVTQVVALRGFYPAESYHQHYADRNPDQPYIVVNDAPKLAALKARYPELYRAQSL